MEPDIVYIGKLMVPGICGHFSPSVFAVVFPNVATLGGAFCCIPVLSQHRIYDWRDGCKYPIRATFPRQTGPDRCRHRQSASRQGGAAVAMDFIAVHEKYTVNVPDMGIGRMDCRRPGCFQHSMNKMVRCYLTLSGGLPSTLILYCIVLRWIGKYPE